MRFLAVTLCLLSFGDLALAQGCTQQMIQQLQARATPPQVIAQMCGSGAAPVANVCATQFGFCPFRGPINVPCTCHGQFGAVQGVSR